MYADDLYLICKHNKNINIQTEINSLFLYIDEWCVKTGTKISFNKTKVLHICKKKSCLNTNITIQNNLISNVNSLKILGVIFNKYYTWSSIIII